jgi:hypothetical protein
LPAFGAIALIRHIMKKLLLLFSFAAIATVSYCQDEIKIWNEFLTLVKNNQLSLDRIKPHDLLGDKFKPILLGYLDSIRIQASPSDWLNTPEIVKTDNRIQFLVPWSTRGGKTDFCFSFVVIDNQWYFQHLESIFIRLDKASPPPVSSFPDVSEPQKAWVREEIYWSFIVQNMYLTIAKEKGKEYALALLKDGSGYFVAAKTWVPFASTNKAFILYLCWEQANLRGNNVTLESLSDTYAIVNLETTFFYLYSNTANLKTRISIEDYKQIFETIWQDRAQCAGWNLDIKYSPDYKVKFIFTRDK